MIIDEEEYLAHYGTPRHSGRYPWGSGEDPSSSARDFLGRIDDLKKQGLSEAEIMQGFSMNTSEYRQAKTIANAAQKQYKISMAQRLKDKGMSNVAIGERMGIPESSVRALLTPGAKDRADVLRATADMLKQEVEDKKYIDVGIGVQNHLGISETKLKTAIALLESEGYKLNHVQIPQLGTSHNTSQKVLTKADVPYSEIFKNRDQIRQINMVGRYSEDGGRSFLGVKPPISIDSNRLAIKYGEQGGAKADGVMYIRPGAKDLDLGNSHYAQVRIAVDGTHFIKGMAVYKDDLPDGVDIMFNTNKSDTGSKHDALKPMKKDLSGKIDTDNPFGAVISRQSGALNILSEEGTWEGWSKTLSSQFLSKQSPTLIKTQLEMTLEGRKNRLDEITRLTNPAVRKKLLQDFADDADTASVHLKAAALPRQASHVILPVTSLKETEVFAPNYKHGERVALVRFPHGGTFEIPELVVNNKNPEAIKLLGTPGKGAAKDAIGIHHKVAERLSGADFDGDTVLVIPNNAGRIKSTSALEGLKNFNAKDEYPGYPGMPKMSAISKGRQMGDVSNLITDMTIGGASPAELARAVRHSMVVIDAEKHDLNWRLSAQQNGIAQLKAKYQGGARRGASTLISQKKQTVRVPERKPSYRIDPTTGKRIYIETGKSFVGRDGQVVQKTSRVHALDLTDNAHTMSSGTVVESMYADYSNHVKDLADEARRHIVTTKAMPISNAAKVAYAPHVERLLAALNVAEKNAPLERQAQVVANSIFSAKKAQYPDMEPSEEKKVRAQALTEARLRMGAKKQRIVISSDEWDAIQAGALSNHKLEQILRHADMEQVKKLATPRQATVMTSAKQARARAMLDSGYTQADVASHLGVPLSTLKSFIEE